MWRAWVGFNASHSMGAMLFGLVFAFLALAHVCDMDGHGAAIWAGGVRRMNVGLVIAGSLCLVLAGGHTFVGRLVLDRLPRDLHPTRFGDGALTRGAVVFTWHALSVMLTTTGAVLIALARGEHAHDRG